MDDTAPKTNNQNKANVPPDQPVSGTQVAQNIPNDKIVTDQGQYTPSSSSLNKEIGPSSSSKLSEVVKPSEPEVNLGEDLKNVGITANTDKPKLDEVHEKIGVTQVAENTPVNSAPTGKVVLPMSEEEAEGILKNKKTNFNLHESVGEYAGDYTEDSLPFLAALVVKVVKEMHRRVFKKQT
jgi:hypothetical protein